MQNGWEIGALYNPTYNNVRWSQPGGIGTTVYPQPATGVDLLSIHPFSEYSNVQPPPACGHAFDEPLLQQEWDYDTDSSCMLVCCPVCSFVVAVIEPASEALNTVSYPYIVA